ncbi:uncharacterized protein YndB with AHSA1/START domain [Crossiella equi]|uniref:Uncharacterized protein YndB with AHSA1/START domain n=1 Tax=Crossiella equi TaxID=130796 RepID=A0ABS5A553_9PSEU|nr:SRPBCC domain-containing protein [Crossiella equi]MBP2471369.1 uncharacterized protein YndB with AHSA1/START domain [Crossiella equi]
MSADTTELPDGRVALRVERELRHPVAKVWRALTTPEHLSAWYPFTVVEFDLRPGGVIRFDDGEGTFYDGEVLEVEPPHVFAFREVDDVLHLALSPTLEGSRLVLTHTFSKSAQYGNYASGWQRCLDELTAVLDKDD